jgi:hypothetical protein
MQVMIQQVFSLTQDQIDMLTVIERAAMMQLVRTCGDFNVSMAYCLFIAETTWSDGKPAGLTS